MDLQLDGRRSRTASMILRGLFDRFPRLRPIPSRGRQAGQRESHAREVSYCVELGASLAAPLRAALDASANAATDR